MASRVGGVGVGVGSNEAGQGGVNMLVNWGSKWHCSLGGHTVGTMLGERAVAV